MKSGGNGDPSGIILRVLAVLALGSTVLLPSPLQLPDRPFHKWTREETLGILTNSPWAKQETYTQVIGGIGSGLSGTKEIYSTFFVRFLSARPVREAFARAAQIQANYDGLGKDDKKRFDSSLESGLKTDFHRWIVVALGFRSNDPSVELRVKQFLEAQSTETMRSRAYLTTTHFHQLELVAYYPPLEDVVGAKFVFPRKIAGLPVIFPEDDVLTFELAVPGFDHDLRVRFDVAGMLINDEPVL